MKVTKAELEGILLTADVQLRETNTPKPYKIHLIMDFYEAGGKEYWAEYKKNHPNVYIYFQDDKAIYELNDTGELIKETVFWED